MVQLTAVVGSQEHDAFRRVGERTLERSPGLDEHVTVAATLSDAPALWPIGERSAQSPRPDTGVGVSDERGEHHRGDEEYGHAQQDRINDAAQVVDDDGALGT